MFGWNDRKEEEQRIERVDTVTIKLSKLFGKRITFFPPLFHPFYFISSQNKNIYLALTVQRKED